MNVLVTGATGLLGGYLVRDLLQRGENVRALVLPGEDVERLLECGVDIVRGDITMAQSLPPALDAIDIVFHLAGMMGVWRPLAEYLQVNVTGTELLYQAACQAGVRRFVHASSYTVYGLGHSRPLREDEPLRPDPDPYSLSKAAAERLLRRIMVDKTTETVIIRPGTFFGPGDHLYFGRIAQRLKAGRGVILGRGDNSLPLCYVSDIAQGFLLAGYTPGAAGQIYNITNDCPLTQCELLEAVAESVGGHRPWLQLPYRPVYYGSIVAEHIATRVSCIRPPVTPLGALLFGTNNRHSIEKARHELGFQPQIDLREGIRLSAEWYNLSQINARPVM